MPRSSWKMQFTPWHSSCPELDAKEDGANHMHAALPRKAYILFGFGCELFAGMQVSMVGAG